MITPTGKHLIKLLVPLTSIQKNYHWTIYMSLYSA